MNQRYKQHIITVLLPKQTFLVLPGSIPEQEGWLSQMKLNEKWTIDISRQICSPPLTEKKVFLFRDFYREVDLFRNSFWMFNFCWWNLRDKPFEKCWQTPHLTLFTFLSKRFFWPLVLLNIVVHHTCKEQRQEIQMI